MKEFFKIILYKPLYNLLIFFAWVFPGDSAGLAIILLTLFIKIVLWGVSLKQLRTPLQMRRYQPELKAIQERYKDDRTAAAQAQMAFYKEKGINPLAGCLPLLIQLPILFILYQVFLAGLGSPRLDLIYAFTPHPDQLNTIFFGIDLTKPERIFLPVIAGLMQYFQTRHMQKINPTISTGPNDTMAMMSKQMTFLFPIMTFSFALAVPAGLALYWIASGLFTLVQQVYVERTFTFEEPKVAVTVRSKKR